MLQIYDDGSIFVDFGVLKTGASLQQANFTNTSITPIKFDFIPVVSEPLIIRSRHGLLIYVSISQESTFLQYSNENCLFLGTNDLVNVGQDTSYYGSLAIGTPPVAFNIILDTGSSDLWLASSSCPSSTCTSQSLFTPSSSSSFQNSSTAFSIQYGSGSASGILGQDMVQMAGFEISSQAFGVVDQISSGLLSSSVSGLMGLGF